MKGNKRLHRKAFCAVILFILLLAVIFFYGLAILSLSGKTPVKLERFNIIMRLSGVSTEPVDYMQYYREPGFLPADTVKTDETCYSGMFRVQYNTDGKILDFLQVPKSRSGSTLPLESDFKIQLFIKDFSASAYFIKDGGKSICVLRWEDILFTYSLSGNFEIELLVKIAESLYDN